MPTRLSHFTLNKCVVFALLGGFALLLLDIRVEHNDVIKETWRAWIPLIYSLVMVVLIPIGLAFWQKGGRKLLLFSFAAAAVVGMLGFWFHSHGKPIKALSRVASIWVQLPALSDSEEKHKRKGKGKRKDSGDQAQVSEKEAEPQDAEKEAEPQDAEKEGERQEAEKETERKDTGPTPPLLAPLGFVGLGLIGVLVCLAAFQFDAGPAKKE